MKDFGISVDANPVSFNLLQNMKLRAKVEVQPGDGIPKQKVDETGITPRDLGL
jgi:hypothetical protein